MKKSACKHVPSSTDAAAIEIEEEKQHRRFPFRKSARVCPKNACFYAASLRMRQLLGRGLLHEKQRPILHTTYISLAKVHYLFVNNKIF